MMRSAFQKFNLWIGGADEPERFRLALLAAFVFSLPFDITYSSVIVLTIILSTIIGFTRDKISRIPRRFWVFQLVFFLGVSGYFYSLHKGEAGYLLERQLTILLFPIVLPLAIKINRQKGNLMLLILAISCSVAVLYLFTHMLIVGYRHLHLSVKQAIMSGLFFNHQFSKPLGIHAGYLSLYVSLSIIFLFTFFFRTGYRKYRPAVLSLLLILMAGLFFLASRNTVIAIFMILFFVFPFYQPVNRKRYLIVVSAILCAVIALIYYIPYLNDRFYKELLIDIKPLENGTFINYNSAEPRYERWRGGFDLVRRSPLFGYGTGDEIAMLKTEYIKRGLYISYLENFNAHNQYLSLMLKHGAAGFIVFICSFLYMLRLAFRHRDFIYISFILLLLIGFYTENLLDSNKGIVFFAYFNTFLAFIILNERNARQNDAIGAKLP